METAVTESIHVLHVDDNPDFTDITATYLERTDDRLTVGTAHSATEALSQFDSERIDCIVSDYEMPGRDGIELLQAVRERAPDFPFILFTGKGSEEIASEAISAGVTDYLRKRSSTEQYELLATRIDTAVGQYRAERELERQNDLFRKTQELASVGGWEWYPQRETGYYSEQVLEIYGVDSRSGSKPERDIEEFFHPDDRATIRDAFERAVETGEPYDVEVRVIAADGTEKWVRTRGDPEFEDGSCVRISGTIQDITSRRETEDRLTAYVENASDVLGIVSEDGTFEDLSASVERILGYAPDELEGETVFEYVHPDDHERTLDSFGELTDPDSDGHERVAYRFRDADGSWKWIESIGSRKTDSTLNGYIITTRDISERKAREQELERTRDLLTQTERIADVGGWEIDTESREVFWTEPLFELLGVDDDEEPPLEEALAVYHEDDRLRVEAAIESALDTGEPFDVEARFRRPDGEIRWLRIQGSPTVEAGAVVSLRGAVQDVTEQRRREQLLREMHEIIAHRGQSFEQQVQALLELGREELDTQYGTLSEIDGEEYIFEVVAADNESIQAGDVVPVSATNCEIAASTQETLVLGDVERDAPSEIDRTGFTEWGISCYLGSPVFVDNEVYGTFCFYGTDPRAGQFSEWEVTLVDLMARWVSYELQRQQVTAQLSETNEQLEQFVSIVSHDLRNPLNVIGLEADLASDDCDSDHLDAVRDAHERMETLIEELLTLAREGETVEDSDRVELAVIVGECWTNVETADATVVCDSDRIIEADRSRLKHVFENLFRNSVEHSSGDVTVTVGDVAGGFYVADDGPGIPEVDREEVLEPGYSTSEDGTGFGMSIVGRMIDAHGWELEITESATGGARFEITGVEIER